jgi:hypothetical protein
MGGLGNQLFQYALGRAIEISCHEDVSFETSFFGSQNKRRYMLDVFNTKVKIRSDSFLRIFKREKHLIEHNLEYIPSLFSDIQEGGRFYLDGYWQTEKYFKHIRKELLSEITLKNPYSQDAEILSRAIAASATSVAIHVRHGDYITDPQANTVLGVCSPEYYHRAIETIQQKVHDPHFFIFSDDIEWAKDNLNLDPTMTTYVSGIGLKDEEELMLMSECKHDIIANSSFSWWSAWLNPNTQKIIIAPRAWFKSPDFKTENIIPSSWIRL